MDKIEARKILMDFVYRMRNCGMPWADVEENFDSCLGFESDEEREAYDLVGDAFPHMIVFGYTFRRRY
jgi:hypothetical protein